MILILNEEQLSEYADDYIKLVELLRDRKVVFDKYIKKTSNTTYFLYIIDKQLVGVARTSLLTEKMAKIMHISYYKYKKHRLVSSVFVHPLFRKQGIGKKLIKKIIKNTDKVILDTYLDWTPACKLYLSCGFNIVKNYKHHNDYFLVFAKS